MARPGQDPAKTAPIPRWGSDGPFGILSIVDKGTFQRRLDQVLDHDPTHKDIVAWFGRCQQSRGCPDLS